MSSALTARMKALRVKAQAIPVPTPTFSVFAASQVAWVTELRKSSGVQTQSMPAASAELACSASSAGVSPIAAIEMRSSAAMADRSLLASQPFPPAHSVSPTALAFWLASLNRLLSLIFVGSALSLSRSACARRDDRVHLSLLAGRSAERLDAIYLLLDVRDDCVRWRKPRAVAR